MAVRRTGKLRRKVRRARAEIPFVDAMHEIWLAGMGALSRVQKEGPRAFQTLIVDGAEFIGQGRTVAEKALREAIATVRSTLDERLQATRDQASETWDNLEKLFQGRVRRVLSQAGLPTADEVRTLSKRVDHLNASVERLARARRAAPRRRAVKRRPTHPTAAA